MFVSIYVMNYFSLAEGATEFLLGHDPVDSPAPLLQIGFGTRTCPLMGSMASRTAIHAGALSLVARADVKARAARPTRLGGAGPPRLRVARLGAPRSLAWFAALFACVFHTTIVEAIATKTMVGCWFSPACVREPTLFDNLDVEPEHEKP